MALTRRGTRKRNSILAGIRSAIGRTGGGAVNPGYSIAFQALSISPSDNSIQDVAAGTGSLTVSHADTLYGKQADGVYYPFATNDPVYSGGRVVTNYQRYSQDIGSWTSTGSATVTSGKSDPLGGSNADSIVAGATNDTIYIQTSGLASDIVSGDAINTYWIRRVSGTGDITLRAADNSTSIEISGQLTSSWQRFSVPSSTMNVGTSSTYSVIIMATSGDEIEVFGVQTESTLNRKDKTTPSEYIPTTTAAVTKVFNTAGWERGSPNAVVDNVVTENARKVTNNFTYSEDFSNAAWGKSNVTVTHGIDDPNGGTTATRVEATATNGGLTQNYVHATGSSPIHSYWLRRVSGTGAVNIMTGSTAFTDISGELTTEWKRFVGSTVMTDSNARGGIYISTSGDIVDIAFAQGEKETNRIDKKTPSEYCPSKSLDGIERVTNGGFDTDSDWTKGSGWTIAGGVATCDGTTGVSVSQTHTDLKDGDFISVSFDITSYTSGNIRVQNDLIANGVYRSAVGSYTEILEVATDSPEIWLTSASFIGSIDNVSIVKLTDGIEVKTGGNPNTVLDSVVTEGSAPTYPINLDTLDGMPDLVGGKSNKWSIGTGWTDNGDGSFTSAGSNQYQGITLNVFKYLKKYRLTFDIEITSGTFVAYLGASGGSPNSGSISASGSYSYDLVAGQSGGIAALVVRAEATNSVGTISNIKLYEQNDGLWLQYLPGTTNSCTYSNDLTNAAWINTADTALDETGLDGVSSNATTLGDSSAVAKGNKGQIITIPDDSNSNTLVLYFKKDSDQTRFPCLDLLYTGGTIQYNYIRFNTATGLTNTRASSGTVDHEMVDDGDWWKLLIQVDNNTTGNTSAQITLYPAFANTISGDDVDAQGSIIVGNIEFYKNKTIPEVRGLSPVFTTTAAVTVAKTSYNFDLANHSDSAQMVVLELFSEVSGTEYAAINTSHTRLWSSSTSQSVMMYFGNGSGNIFNRDGTETTATASDYGDANTVHKVGAVWDDTDSLKTVGVDSDVATPEAYDGSYNLTGTIQTLSDNPCPMKVRNIKLYSIDSWTKGYAALQNFLS